MDHAYLERVFPRDCEEEDAGLNHVLLAVSPAVFGHHHLFATFPHAVQQTVLAQLVLVVDTLFLGLFTCAAKCRHAIRTMWKPVTYPTNNVESLSDKCRKSFSD